ncbi:hypothetical protein M0R45_009226 [Rubus argutus]|uniref:Uncharacterized protein n=1 Tax=Rubus argutus TaxID=59490 RepID=A0AAW1Y4C2_RUBAR
MRKGFYGGEWSKEWTEGKKESDGSAMGQGVDKEAGREENVPSGEQVLDVQYGNTLRPRHSEAVKKKKKKKKGLMTEVFNTFKKADVNLPLLDLISRVPAYAEFVKNLCMHKKKFIGKEKIVLKEEASAIIQRRASCDIHNPTSFVVGCTIGDKSFDRALMDMCTCINIMPLATFRKLAIGTLQPTSISVQLADETFRMPVGIVEDVLVRVDKFILPADFVILDMDEDPNIENGLPIILGSSFMATAGAKINVQKGTVKLKVLGEKVKLQVLQPIFPLNVIKEVFSVDLVKGNQAKSERIFGPLNPPKPQVEIHPSIVAEKQELPEISYSDDDDMFDEFVHSYVHDDINFAASTYESELNSFSVPLPVHKAEASFACVLPELDLDPHFMGQQSSSFEQAHQLNEFESPQLQEVVKPTSTINECARGGIPPTPYIPPHRRGILPTPYFHPHEHRLSSSFESFKMTSPPCSEVQLEAIQCLREILGIGINRMKTYECHPYLSYYGGRQMCYAPP